jgi:phosphoglycerol transferase
MHADQNVIADERPDVQADGADEIGTYSGAPARSGGLRSHLVEAALVVGVTLMAVVVVFKLWDANLSVPWLYGRDGISQAAITKGILRDGWWTTNHSLGFPLGLDYRDYPLGGENAHWLLIKALGAFSSDPNLITNTYFLLGFFLISLSAHFVLRAFGVARWFAVTGAVLFAFLPYHLLRGTWHLTLGAFWSVPIACLFTILLQRDPLPFFARVDDRLRVDWTSPRSLWLVVGALVIGSAGTYNAAFAIVLMLCVALVRCIAVRDVRPIVVAVALCGFIGVAFLANNASALQYQREHGKNTEVAQRTVPESDNYALRPVQLVSPIPGHRIPAFSKVTAEVLGANNNSEGTSYLGTVGTIGLLGLALASLSLLAGRRRVRGDELPMKLATPTAFAVVFGVAGGFSWVLGLAGLAEIRAWNRISVFIAFYCLAAVMWWATTYLPRWSWVAARAWVIPALALSLVVLGVADQTSAAIVPDSHGYEAAYASDARFVRRIEQQLQPGDAVYQLPYLPFPEAELETPPYGMVDYDPLRGFLHSDTLEWSYGGMRGRDGDWQESVSRWPREAFLDAITAVGFRGLWIDRFGYADRGRELEADITALVGTPPTVSDDDRFAFYDLERHAAALQDQVGPDGIRALRRSTLAAPRMRPAALVTDPGAATGSSRFAAGDGTRFVVNNRQDTPLAVVVSGRLRSVTGARVPATVTVGDGATEVEATPDGAGFEVSVALVPGNSDLVITTAADPSVPMPLELLDLQVVPR